MNYNHNQTSLSFIGINNPTLDTSNDLFKVSNANSNIIFSNLTFTSSSTSKQILSQSGGNTVTFNDCTFKDIKLSGEEGLFRGEKSYLYFVNSKFSNFKNNNPIIVLKNYQLVTVTNCQFNTVGKAIYSDIKTATRGGYINIFNSSFNNCFYPVKITANIVNISDSNFTNSKGPVILHEAETNSFKTNTEIYIDNSQFISNMYDGKLNQWDPSSGDGATDTQYGGVIYSQAKVLNVSNTLFKDNLMRQGNIITMNLKGCGIYASNIYCINSTFDNNRITGGGSSFRSDGSAIYATGNANILNSTFINNYVNIEGGGAIYGESNLNVFNCLFSNNKQPKGYSSITFSGISKINNNIFLDLGNIVTNKTENYDLDYN